MLTPPSLPYFHPDVEEACRLLEAHRQNDGWAEDEVRTAWFLEIKLWAQVRDVLDFLFYNRKVDVLRVLGWYQEGACSLADLEHALRPYRRHQFRSDHVDLMLVTTYYASQLGQHLRRLGILKF